MHTLGSTACTAQKAGSSNRCTHWGQLPALHRKQAALTDAHGQTGFCRQASPSSSKPFHFYWVKFRIKNLFKEKRIQFQRKNERKKRKKKQTHPNCTTPVWWLPKGRSADSPHSEGWLWCFAMQSHDARWLAYYIHAGDGWTLEVRSYTTSRGTDPRLFYSHKTAHLCHRKLPDAD